MVEYKKAITIDPKEPQTHCNLGLVQLDLGDRSSALEEHKVLKRLDAGLADGALQSYLQIDCLGGALPWPSTSLP